MDSKRGAAMRPAVVTEEMVSLGLLLGGAHVPNERHLQWLCFAAQELDVMPRHYEFSLVGGEVFSPELDMTLAAMEASGLVVDTGTGASLVLTDKGQAVLPPERPDLGRLAQLQTAQLAQAGRLLQLRLSGVPETELARVYQRRFAVRAQTAKEALRSAKELRRGCIR
jgi:hypothetical protein